MSRRILPYRTPSDDVLKPDEWTMVVGDDEFPMPDALPDWDYLMDLNLRRSVRVDLDRARSEAGLHPDSVLNLTVVWTATGSSLRASAARVRLEEHGVRNIEMSTRLKGADLGGLLILDTVLVLAEPSHDGAPAAARRAGSVLWSDRHTLRLQGDAPQFPMAVIDFSKTSFPEGAASHLQISSNLLGATMGSLLLLINEQNSVVATAFRNASRPRSIDRVVLSAVYADVARVMIEHALRHPDFIDDAIFPDDTLGATLAALFHRLFPNSSINDMRLRLKQAPSLFASDLQSAVRIFEDV